MHCNGLPSRTGWLKTARWLLFATLRIQLRMAHEFAVTAIPHKSTSGTIKLCFGVALATRICQYERARCTTITPLAKAGRSSSRRSAGHPASTRRWIPRACFRVNHPGPPTPAHALRSFVGPVDTCTCMRTLLSCFMNPPSKRKKHTTILCWLPWSTDPHRIFSHCL